MIKTSGRQRPAAQLLGMDVTTLHTKIMTEYFGYQRRTLDDAADRDFEGYDFWLTELKSFNGSSDNAEMAKAFGCGLQAAH